MRLSARYARLPVRASAPFPTGLASSLYSFIVMEGNQAPLIIVPPCSVLIKTLLFLFRSFTFLCG